MPRRALSIPEAIVADLRAEGRPRTSRDLAARFLRIEGGDEETCSRLLFPLLAAVPGLRYVPGQGWTCAMRGRDAGNPAPSALRSFASLAADGGGPGGSGRLLAACLLLVDGGEPGPDRVYPAWAADGAEGVDPAIAGGARPGVARPSIGPSDLRNLIETIGDRPLICHRRARDVEPILRACADAGLLFHPSVISTARLGQIVLDLKRGHSAIDLAGALGVETRGPDDCRGRVRIVTAAWLALLPRLLDRGLTGLDAILEFQTMPAPPPDLSRYDFDENDLRALPDAPGVYRFLDASGRVIYVGKTKNLRHRVRSYFLPSARRSAKIAAIRDGLRSFACETVASDLEAELLEAALIVEHRPPLNRQFEVHERSAPYGPRLNLIVVLPDAASGTEPTCTLHLLRGGRYLCRLPGLPAGREEGGEGAPPATGRTAGCGLWSRAAERIESAYFGPGAPGGSPGSGEASPSPADVDGELVSSYLRRRRDSVNLLDVDECSTVQDAVGRLRVLADAAGPGRQRIFARGPGPEGGT